ncbi:c-type cytochrome biogenesis protein CcmI [Roseovarius sp. 2305UL8-3]|uniref:c-type cytochrome biogenesis protein CcmI n=1 Tax=Roseovarius conchicola TaxID=3121636 RepID=UPI0035287E82
MTFWIIIAVIALAVSALFVRAALHGRAGEVPPAAYDLQVYRDQLKEVDRDLARGVISEDEAERVRTEVSRRILAADAQLKESGGDGGQPGSSGFLVGGLALVAVVGGSILLYRDLGTPGFQDVPIKARIAASDEARANRLTQAEVEARMPAPHPVEEASEEFLSLMEQLREKVAENPTDIRGLSLLSRNEAALGNLSAAIDAQQQLLEVRGDEADAADHTYLAELKIGAAGGYVSSEAETALRRALSLDPDYPFARYYLAQYLMQVDRPDAAFRTMKGLIEDGPGNAPWVLATRDQIGEVAWRAGEKYELPPLDPATSGPSAEDVANAQDMSEEDRRAMIEGMVAGLAERLATEGGPPEDWAQLIRAQGVLGETGAANAIWEEAQQVFADNTDALETLRRAAHDAGVIQ